MSGGLSDPNPQIEGATDGTKIGNVGDRLKTHGQLVGSDGSTIADVELISGKKRLLTDAIVVVEELFGKDPIPDSWFRITNAGVSGNSVRVQVAATANDPTTPDRDAPAADVTIAVTASEAGDEIALRDKIIVALNADTNFANSLKATKVKDNAIVHVSSKFRGEFWERTAAGSFAVTTTGSAAVVVGFADLIIRGKPTELARSPDDPRQGILGISGSVTATPGAVADLFLDHAVNAGSTDLRVNGSVTPVVFSVPISATKTIFVQELRLYGNGNGIKFGQFLSQNASLTNGLLVEVKSDNMSQMLATLKSTDDIKHLFAFGGGTFDIDVQAGRDDFMATWAFGQPFPLKKTGTYSPDDYLRITVRDNLAAGLLDLRFVAFGFEKEE